MIFSGKTRTRSNKEFKLTISTQSSSNKRACYVMLLAVMAAAHLIPVDHGHLFR